MLEGETHEMIFTPLSGIARYPEEIHDDAVVTLYTVVVTKTLPAVAGGEGPRVTRLWSLLGIQASDQLPAESEAEESRRARRTRNGSARRYSCLAPEALSPSFGWIPASPTCST